MDQLPNWLAIIIAVVGLLGTVLGVLGISGYLGERARHKAEKQNKKEDKAEEDAAAARKKTLQDTIRGVFQEEMKPIENKLNNISVEIEHIKNDLADNTIGTVTILRDRMKSILDACRDDGYASTSTKGNWHELYNTYKSLGGNHFKEYVDAWKEELDELPAVPPTKKSRKPKTDTNDKK